VTKLKIIYVLGPAYTGSTLLGLALGSHGSILNLGEVTNLESDYSDGSKCTCGKVLIECGFWSEIRRSIGDSVDEVNFNLSSQGERELLDQRGGLNKLWLLLRRRLIDTFPKSYLAHYANKNTNFLRAVARAHPEKEFIIDLSKSPERLDVLRKNVGVDVWCVYVKRDPLKVYASTLERPKLTRAKFGFKSIREAVWLLVRARDMDRVYSSMPENRRVELNFEEFVCNPVRGINSILELVGLSSLPIDGSKNMVIKPSQQHIYVGNRWLFSPGLKNVEIKEKHKINRLSFFQRLVFRIIWFGYLKSNGK
jgi:hypothetical protein